MALLLDFIGLYPPSGEGDSLANLGPTGLKKDRHANVGRCRGLTRNTLTYQNLSNLIVSLIFVRFNLVNFHCFYFLGPLINGTP